MSKITVIGGTGYAGSWIVREAARRNHQVTSLSRSAPAEPTAHVNFIRGSVLDEDVIRKAITGADVVVATLSPRGELTQGFGQVYEQIVKQTTELGARLIVVGGFGSLRPQPGAPRFATGADFPAEYAGEARALVSVLEDLLIPADPKLDWIFVSPAGGFGAFAPGERLGKYRLSDEIAIFDEEGQSAISGADFAIAIVDVIEQNQHHRAHIGVAY